ncbi:hypothetical protein [Haloferax larsenii]|uniref:hypothetical protein n=1 Tax=Haloferax larsenii TaxID=302484 RepID=UPI0009451134|nr:hypothetical protein [Haloferax larsenii]
MSTACAKAETLSQKLKEDRGARYEKTTQKTLRDAVPDADVVVVLLTKGAFMDVVEPIWDELVETTKPGAIWGFGLPRSALDSVDLEPLRTKNDLHVYRRSGVARLGTETRNQLLAAVRERSEN